MEKKILLFVGKKQSGKTSAANFVVGYVISQLGRLGYPYLPDNFTINEDGMLEVPTVVPDEEGDPKFERGILDLTRRDENFVRWANDCMWPYVKVYSYATILKNIAITVFNIPEKLVNGNNEDKRKLTHIKWKNMCRFLPPMHVKEIKRAGKYDSRMSVREFLQFFGTNVCRHLYPDCWVQACFKEIQIDNPNLAIISDGRFENEIKVAKKHNAKIVKLERVPYNDLHESEIDIDKMHNNNYDLIIPSDVSLKEKNQRILDAMYDWGWFGEHIERSQ